MNADISQLSAAGEIGYLSDPIIHHRGDYAHSTI